MRHIHYAMSFRGRVSRASEHCRFMKNTSSAASCTLRMLIGRRGLVSVVNTASGELAFLDSELHVTGPESFREVGTIAFGDESDHVLRFSTLGEGYLCVGSEPETLAGAASWQIDGGEGQFSGAHGLIASVFTVTRGGEINNLHSGFIVLPD
jgi:hypothetical protein